MLVSDQTEQFHFVCYVVSHCMHMQSVISNRFSNSCYLFFGLVGLGTMSKV